MLAVLLTLGLFLVWCVVGLAALAALRVDVGDTRVALTAPILGTALTVLPLFVLSNAGVPMDPGAVPVWGVLLGGSLLVLTWRRPRPSLAVLPVLVLCLVELVLVGRPMFDFGFDWIANANGDMGYYVLSATELMRHGLQTAVDFHALAANRDFATASQTLNLRGLRPGTQITLAGLAAATGRSPVTLYMPMSIAIAMCGVCATGSLALQASRRWWAAAIAAALIVVSPLAGYGVLQQLLPQDWGLGLAVGLFAWLMRPEMHGPQRPRLSDLVAISVLGAALFIVAYEVAASLALAYVLYVAILIMQRRVSLRAVGLLWSVPLVVTVVVLNTFLSRALRYLNDYVLHFATSGGFKGLPLFGYAVVPTALPGVAGLQRLFVGPEAPHMGLYILVAAGIFAGVLIAVLVETFRGAAASITLLADVALGAKLARSGNDFGLFKLYMYMQPFLAATVAVSLSSLRRRRTLVAAAGLTAVVVGFQVSTLNAYVEQSMNPVDLRNASQADLLPKFRRLLADATHPVVTVTDNFVLDELEGASAGNKPLYFLSRNIFDSSWKVRRLHVPTAHGVTEVSFSENVDAARILASGSCMLVVPSGSQLALNRLSLPEGSPNLIVRRCGESRNVLAFVVSSRGQPATLPANRRAVSLWQLEPDPSFRGRTFSGFGRFALFQLLDPTQGFRVVLDFTTSPIQMADGSFRLPPAAVVGTTRARFAVVGSGSARVVSPPLRPRMIDGRPYIVLDMGRNGQFPLVRRPGLTGLWGKSVLLDPRSLTSYVRDISLVSLGQYSRMRAPTAIRSIPADLANPGLEYSGIFEDGWIGRTSYARLSGGPSGQLVLRALVLARPRRQQLRVLVNGRPVASRSVKPGSLDLDIPIPASSGSRTVELRWAGATRLAPPDRRTVAAHLTFLGVAQPPLALRSVPAGLSDPGLAYSGIFKDGWLRKDARLVLAGGVAGKLSFRALVAVSGQRLELRVNGRTVASRAVKPGRVEIQAAIAASSSSRVIELRWGKTARIAANDPRRAAALLQSITVGPT